MEFYRVSQAAIVSRADVKPNVPEQYLKLNSGGAADWTPDPDAATVFESMREAMRAATRLPAALRAYSLPWRGAVLTAQGAH
jgi:hypothetical protein